MSLLTVKAMILFHKRCHLIESQVSALSAPQRLPLSIRIKIAIIKKIESARGTMGRGPSPFPPCPARSLFLSPQPPYNTKRPLRRRQGICLLKPLYSCDFLRAHNQCTALSLLIFSECRFTAQLLYKYNHNLT